MAPSVLGRGPPGHIVALLEGGYTLTEERGPKKTKTPTTSDRPEIEVSQMVTVFRRGCTLHGLEHFAEILVVALRVPVFTFYFEGIAEFKFDIFDVLVAKRALHDNSPPFRMEFGCCCTAADYAHAVSTQLRGVYHIKTKKSSKKFLGQGA
jgi:hypothetical protein